MFLTTYPLISLYTHNGDGTLKTYIQSLQKFFKKKIFKGTNKNCTQTQWGLISTFLIRCFHFYVENFPGFNLDFIKYNNAGIIFQFNIWVSYNHIWRMVMWQKINYSLNRTYSAITLNYSLARYFRILTHVTATGLCQNTPTMLQCTLSVWQTKTHFVNFISSKLRSNVRTSSRYSTT